MADETRRRAPAIWSGSDPLGLKRALADRLLFCLVAAMALLASLALAGRGGAEALSLRWQRGAQTSVTVQIPEPDPARMARAIAILEAQPEIASARIVDPTRLREMLRPWIGETEGLVLPGVIEVRLVSVTTDPARIGEQLARALPGALTEAHGVWSVRLVTLARAVQGLAIVVLALVAAVAAAVIAVATRAGIAARQDAILVLHGLGATDRDIARRIAARAAWLGAMGGLLGTALAIVALMGIVALAAPMVGEVSAELPAVSWLALAAVPVATWLIGWVTAEASVRWWLRKLP